MRGIFPIMDKELLKGHLPVLVLGLLAHKPMHGYAICEALAGESGTGLELGEGTIYPLLHRLERQGHISARWQRGETGKQRKVYEITTSGARMIATHRSDLQTLQAMFQSVFGKGWVQE